MLKKIWIGIVLAGVLVAAFAAAGDVYAQAVGPQGVQDNSMPGIGRRGVMIGNQGFARTGDGLLHEYMVAAFAEKLGVEVEVLNERLANGERMLDIALDLDFTVEEFRTLMLDARTQAIDAALADGVITPEQADWMKMRGSGASAGQRAGKRGGFGGNLANCPMYNQTIP